MPSKPISIYKLTPAQIALVDRLADAENGVPMDKLGNPEIVAWMELEKLGFADMQIRRRKAVIVLTKLGAHIRASGYFSKKPVVRLTEPQSKALRFLAGGRHRYVDIPGPMVDVCRRMSLRGWAEWDEDADGNFRMRITKDGWNILKLIDVPAK